MKLIVGEHLQAYSNRVWIFGKRRGSGENIWDLRKRIGLVTPELQMNYQKNITGRKVVYSGFLMTRLAFTGAISEQQKEMAEKWLNQFDLFEIAESSFLNLSYGQQRLFYWRSCGQVSSIAFLLDEPCQGQSYQRTELIKKVDLLGKSKVTQILYISHQVEDKLGCIHATIFYLTEELKGICQILRDYSFIIVTRLTKKIQSLLKSGIIFTA